MVFCVKTPVAVEKSKRDWWSIKITISITYRLFIFKVPLIIFINLIWGLLKLHIILHTLTVKKNIGLLLNWYSNSSFTPSFISSLLNTRHKTTISLEKITNIICRYYYATCINNHNAIVIICFNGHEMKPFILEF